jgi:competence protein ComEC
MRAPVLAFACGVFALQSFPDLPSRENLLLASILCGFGVVSCRLITNRSLRLGLMLVASALAGLAWAGWRAESRLADALPMTSEMRDVVVTGVVEGLPERLERGARRFVLAVGESDDGVPARIRLSWYPSRTGAVPVPPTSDWTTSFPASCPRCTGRGRWCVSASQASLEKARTRAS